MQWPSPSPALSNSSQDIACRAAAARIMSNTAQDTDMLNIAIEVRVRMVMGLLQDCCVGFDG